jgi:hypothetical protein
MARLGRLIVVLIILLETVAAGADTDAGRGDVPGAILVVRSDPTGAVIRLDGLEFSGSAPDTLVLDSRSWTLQLSLEGFQPLTHSLVLAPGSEVILTFIMLQTPPEMPLPEDLGMAYEPIIPHRNEAEALAVRQKFNALTETFLVFPMAQGLIGKLAFEEDSTFPADELFYSGIALVTLSSLAGKYFFNKKLDDVNRANQEAEASNATATIRNKEVDRALSNWHEEAVLEWQETTRGRGQVKTTVLRPGIAAEN